MSGSCLTALVALGESRRLCQHFAEVLGVVWRQLHIGAVIISYAGQQAPTGQ